MERVIQVLVSFTLLILPLSASEPQYISFDIPGAQWTRPFGVNARGQIVGIFRDANGRSHGFLTDWTDLASGQYTQIDVPGAIFTNASSINARGDIVGRWSDSAGYNHAYLRSSDGQFVLFDPAAPCVVTKSPTVAHGISDIGDIVGRCFDSGGKELGFLRRHDGTFMVLDQPEWATTDAWLVDNQGVIVGDYSDALELVHGYIWTEAGGFVTFDVPGADASSVRSINERGDLAGLYAIGTRIFGFVLRKGDAAIAAISYPGSRDFGANLVINDSGLLVGGYVDASGNEHGLVAIQK